MVQWKKASMSNSSSFFKDVVRNLAHKRDGFTILEMLVVISVMTTLSGILVIYSRTSENQILLFKEQAKIVSAFFRAKTLASQTFSETDPKPCAYGVALSGTDFYIFKDLPDSATPDDCATANRQFDGTTSGEVFEVIPLDERLVLGSADTTFDEVLFIPPDPSTLLNRSAAVATAQVVVKVSGGDSGLGVRINDAGQITSFRPL
jgi:prepilin-type N-terminal cleavage/methylation domain-containing protein